MAEEVKEEGERGGWKVTDDGGALTGRFLV